ncbi:MAG: LysM peptidoglycan-binding domain-containing protein [Alphaproteobacteria bacterium]|nr:LysM peptidoglycan-binding domain-containing protein [Alphaproteobacteria bacterium]
MSDNTYTGRGLTLADFGTKLGQELSWQLSGITAMLGLGGERLAKMQIRHEVARAFSFDGKFDVLFNPSQVSLSRSVAWQKDASGKGTDWSTELSIAPANYAPGTLSLDLFFDTTLTEGQLSIAGDFASASAAQAFLSPTGGNVLVHTQKVTRLALPSQELHRPPICQLWWGPYKLMQGVLSSVNQTYTHWLPDGTPVRANLSCMFMEYEKDDRWEFHSPDVEKSHTVRRGDTLHAIAALYFGDVRRWVDIAEHNGIDNPRVLTPGQVLRIPSLKEG